MSFFEWVPLVRFQSMLHCGGGDNFYTLDDVFNTEEERKTKMLIYRLQDMTRDYCMNRVNIQCIFSPNARLSVQQDDA